MVGHKTGACEEEEGGGRRRRKMKKNKEAEEEENNLFAIMVLLVATISTTTSLVLEMAGLLESYFASAYDVVLLCSTSSFDRYKSLNPPDPPSVSPALSSHPVG
ncbi:unnamed protein product [Haemonchus placei]|uniref:Transmembrane protein n=1 Tax=Haemonchus placei TaxID=6290 RepID=A0A0N4X1U5_HAEPC|nr:unnamed protein product [Haemonchus placei]